MYVYQQPSQWMPVSCAGLIGGMCSTDVPDGLGRHRSGLLHQAVLSAGLLAVCVVAVTQLPPLHDTAGVLSDAVS
jgi:hypothetical protein